MKIYKRIIVECRVECVKCKSVITKNYVNAQTITMMKTMTKNWRYIEEIGTLCPECIKYIENEESK